MSNSATILNHASSINEALDLCDFEAARIIAGRLAEAANLVAMSNETLTADADRLRWRVDNLTTEVERLRDALRPFAAEARTWGIQHSHELRPVCDLASSVPPSPAQFTVGDLRRALDAVSEEV